MVVYNVVWTWLVMSVKDQAVAHEGMGLNLGRCLVVIYANNGIIRSQESEWLQNAVNVLICLCSWYGIIANVTKSQTMTYQPRSIWLGMSEEAVVRQCTGVGVSYRELLQRRIL